jgi:hypothetical protein
MAGSWSWKAIRHDQTVRYPHPLITRSGDREPRRRVSKWQTARPDRLAEVMAFARPGQSHRHPQIAFRRLTRDCIRRELQVRSRRSAKPVQRDSQHHPVMGLDISIVLRCPKERSEDRRSSSPYSLPNRRGTPASHCTPRINRTAGLRALRRHRHSNPGIKVIFIISGAEVCRYRLLG